MPPRQSQVKQKQKEKPAMTRILISAKEATWRIAEKILAHPLHSYPCKCVSCQGQADAYNKMIRLWERQ
jgi:hypothetical protein